VIFHIPHSSAKLPVTYDRLPRSYIDEFTDWGSDTLFSHEAADRVVFGYSRFFVDVERLADDPLDAKGNGFFYTHTPDSVHCYRSKLDLEFVEAKRLYDQWHHNLRKLAARNLCYTENVVLIDCHTFSDKQAALIHGEMDFPDICIGFNADADPKVPEMLVRGFQDNGYSVAENFPFSNAVKPLDDPGLHCVMIEVNKRLDYAALRPVITEILEEVARFEFS